MSRPELPADKCFCRRKYNLVEHGLPGPQDQPQRCHMRTMTLVWGPVNPWPGLAGRAHPLVRVTLEREALAPAQPPKDWLHVRVMGNVLAFVDTRFKEESLGASVASVLDGVRTVDAQPMGLRSIFTTLARATRDATV